jgi:hypothetical protein
VAVPAIEDLPAAGRPYLASPPVMHAPGNPREQRQILAKKTVGGGNLEGSVADDRGTMRSVVTYPESDSMFCGSPRSGTAQVSLLRSVETPYLAATTTPRPPVAAGRLLGERLPHGGRGRDARLCTAGASYIVPSRAEFPAPRKKGKEELRSIRWRWTFM